VPAIAVMQEEGTNNRFLFVKEGKTARKVDVRIGQRFDDQFEVISRKLHEDMPLIVAGQSNLTDGAKIRVK
jgi:multidrug efflux pump subunit AcrA (membrane-fusion protein)